MFRHHHTPGPNTRGGVRGAAGSSGPCWERAGTSSLSRFLEALSRSDDTASIPERGDPRADSDPGFSPPSGTEGLLGATRPGGLGTAQSSEQFGDSMASLPGMASEFTREGAGETPTRQADGVTAPRGGRGVVVKGVTVRGVAPHDYALIDPERNKRSLAERARMLAQAEDARALRS